MRGSHFTGSDLGFWKARTWVLSSEPVRPEALNPNEPIQ